MAGLGKRFANEGYVETKPLIPVSGKPMVVQAVDALPAAEQYAFVLRGDMPGLDRTRDILEKHYPECLAQIVEKLTEGQACTALIGLEALEDGGGCAQGPITFGACDFAALFNEEAFHKLAAAPDTDILVWSVRGHPNAARHPQMYGWIETDGDKITGISVKTPLASPATDPIVLGTFTFRNADIFKRSVQALFARDGRINGEFYLDSCINDALSLGFTCRVFEVDSYISWGVPDDLRTFEYWQSCFHKWASHPYRLENDCQVEQRTRPELAARYSRFEITVPKA
jgi:hypothetical protein